MRDEDLVTVFAAQGMVQALLIKGKLESAGCPVILSYEALSSALPTTTDGLGQVLVQVPPAWEADARRELENVDFDAPADAEIDFEAPGESSPEQG